MRPSPLLVVLLAAAAGCGDSTGLDGDDLALTTTEIPVGASFEEFASASFTKTGGIAVNGAVSGSLCNTDVSVHAEIDDRRVRVVVRAEPRDGVTACPAVVAAIVYDAEVPSLEPGRYVVSIDHRAVPRPARRMVETTLQVR